MSISSESSLPLNHPHCDILGAKLRARRGDTPGAKLRERQSQAIMTYDDCVYAHTYNTASAKMIAELMSSSGQNITSTDDMHTWPELLSTVQFTTPDVIHIEAIVTRTSLQSCCVYQTRH